MTRFDFIDRVIAERSSTKGLTQDTRDFLMISRYLVTVVGEDYIQGLIQQKKYDWQMECMIYKQVILFIV